MPQQATNQITPFDFKGNQIRTVTAAEGEPWFVLKDVCDVLDMSSPHKVATRLNEDDRNSIPVIDSLGREQQTTVVNESGLYDVILDSRKPQAREFRHWITNDVLPSIRKRGGYLTPEAAEQALTDPDFIIRLATELKEERARTAALQAQAAIDAPKALFADAVSTSHTTILVGDLAKILKGNGVNIGANRLFKWLRTNGFLIARKGTDWNMPTQRSMELGLFKVKETAVTHSDGHVSVSKTPKVTGKGQQYFTSRFLDGTFSIDGTQTLQVVG